MWIPWSQDQDAIEDAEVGVLDVMDEVNDLDGFSINNGELRGCLQCRYRGGFMSMSGGFRQCNCFFFFAKFFSRVERNYCITRRELLAMIKGIEHFRHYLYGRRR